MIESRQHLHLLDNVWQGDYGFLIGYTYGLMNEPYPSIDTLGVDHMKGFVSGYELGTDVRADFDGDKLKAFIYSLSGTENGYDYELEAE